MVDAILTTKLYIPPARSELVSRPRLIDRLTDGLTRKLIVISAPAGFGKTTLLGEWVGHSELPVAWVSLDESDNDLPRFLTYVVAALQTIDTDLGAAALSDLQSPQPLPTESILTSLINEVTETSQDFILVLDDYHRIEVRPIHDALTFLLDGLPPQMHLAIATRSDPPLPLARLRGRGELSELRAADLRFTANEAATYLNQVMGLDLSAEEVAALENRTEGWIVGLQMAALSMQGREDSANFVRAFTGSHHFVIDYLLEEVLQRQPERVRQFLVQTAILDHLNGPLCDAVTGQEDGRGMLESLERGNLFVVPLDDEREWYRYHHLFADVLQARLMEEQPNQIPDLHRRASEWYEQSDLPSDAIRHALAGEDFERAAGLVELAAPAMRRSRQDATIQDWVKELPDELVRARPVLSVVTAWALLNGGELEGVEARLQDAERWLDTAADMREPPEARALELGVAEMVVVDEAQFRSLPASIANARAYRAQALGDLPGTVTYTRLALDLLPEDDDYERGTTASLLGLAYWASGDLEAAHRTFAEGLASLQMGGGILVAITGAFILASIRAAQGRLHEAVSTLEQSLQLAAELGEHVPPGTAELHVGLSELHREQGDLEAATQHLLRGEALGKQASLPFFEYLWWVARARIKKAQGELDGAIELLQKAERLYQRTPLPDVHPIGALKTRVWVAQGRLTEGLGWARERDLSVEDDLSYLREFEHITLARVLIARYRSERVDDTIHDAMGLLERLLKAAEEGEWTGSVIEILLLQALAYQAQGDVSPALAPLERALTLAEPEGYVQIFVDEGPPMAALLREAAKNRIAPNYVSQLLTALGKAEGTTPVAQLSIEPLSERELEVLRLLGTELKGPEIARELVIALSTVRTHTKSIYSKLNVNNRRAAVKRAAELDLI